LESTRGYAFEAKQSSDVCPQAVWDQTPIAVLIAAKWPRFAFTFRMKRPPKSCRTWPRSQRLILVFVVAFAALLPLLRMQRFVHGRH
jgi:hypothetical protein